MTDKLTTYCGALLEVKERRLLTLSDNVPARFYLDEVWNLDFVNFVLSQAQWTFARRTVRLDPNLNVQPQFGQSYAFQQPDDYLRNCALCSDEFFNVPLLVNEPEAGYWYASVTPLYLKYVSNNIAYGGNLGVWPANFSTYVAFELAWRVLPKLSGNDSDREALRKRADKMLHKAQSTDAMEEPTKFPPPGTFTDARQRGRTGSGWDRGSRAQLYG